LIPVGICSIESIVQSNYLYLTLARELAWASLLTYAVHMQLVCHVLVHNLALFPSLLSLLVVAILYILYLVWT